MESMVRNIISNYNSYTSEMLMYKQWVKNNSNPQNQSRLAILEQKVAIIDAWLNLLNHDEAFVIREHLINQLEWPRVAFKYRERWKNEFYRTERCLQMYQANAIAKIADFAQKHYAIMLALFSDDISA